MEKYVVWYTCVSHYPVEVSATSEKNALARANRIIDDANEGRDTYAVNRMYDQHKVDDEFKLSKVCKS